MSLTRAIIVDRANADKGMAIIRPISDECGLDVEVPHEAERPSIHRQRIGCLLIDFDKQGVDVGGVPVHMPRTEYRLLMSLARRAGAVVTIEELCRELFGGRPIKSSHYVRMYIRLLRKRIEKDPDSPRIILNVWGKGYRLCVTRHDRNESQSANASNLDHTSG